MNDEEFKQLFNMTIHKMVTNPDEFFDNDKLQKKYNEKLKENIKLKKQLEAYENMRKEVLSEIEYFELQAQHLNDDIYLDEKLTQKLKDILNKVGGSDE